MKAMDKLIEGFFSSIGAIPPNRVQTLATLLGDLWFAVDRSHRRIALNNLENAFHGQLSNGERRHLTRRVFRNLVRIPFEIGWALRLDREQISSLIDIDGLHHARKAVEKKKGVIFLTGHTGNWELLSMISAYSDIPVNIVYRPLDFAPMDRFIAGFRSRFGAKLIPKEGSLKRLLSCLRKNEAIALVMDQRVGHKKGAFVDFFGRMAVTTKGPAYLAGLTGSPVLPVFIRRSGSRFVIQFGEELPLVKTGDRERDVISNTVNYNRAIEDYVRCYPSQWLWIHRRWRIRGGAHRQMDSL